MRPFVIEVRWIDFSATLQDDVYEVVIKDQSGSAILTRWEITGDNVGNSITKYMRRQDEVV